VASIADDDLLAGCRVLDLTRLLPGGYCTLLLAGAGADVIKVEHPDGGDPARAAGPLLGAHAVGFEAFNRGKRSVALDLKTERGCALARALARTSDVVVESFRPGVAARLGVSAEDLRGADPRLVYCSITGYGQDGPLRDRPGHDINYQARAGTLALELDGRRPPPLPAVPTSDLAAGVTAAFAIAAALVRRERGGEGAHIDLSMTGVALQWGSELSLLAAATGAEPARGDLHWTGGSAGYNVYETADGGHMALGAEEPKFWRAFCAAVGRDDLAARDALATGDAGAALVDEVAALFAGRDRAHWEDLFDRTEVPCDPVLAPGEALARSAAGSTPGQDRALLPAMPFRYGAGARGARRGAPALGEHGHELDEELRARGVV
jgi:crotonobetainyl-CoA:carnitine CoA-transferase CaiB-like acyl-CoA transferase